MVDGGPVSLAVVLDVCDDDAMSVVVVWMVLVVRCRCHVLSSSASVGELLRIETQNGDVTTGTSMYWRKKARKIQILFRYTYYKKSQFDLSLFT